VEDLKDMTATISKDEYAGATPTAGHQLRHEIAQQPDVLSDVLSTNQQVVIDLAERIRSYSPRMVVFVARGTSANACLYGRYLVETSLGLPTSMASPSVTTVGGANVDLRGCLVIAVSQSGSSPDLVETLAAARRHGALTLAMVNEPVSKLDDEAELSWCVGAGRELAVPATKSYTAQLLNLWMLVQAWMGQDLRAADPLPGLARHQLGVDVDSLADRYRFADRFVLVGRLWSYVSALESALKIVETTLVPTHAWSAAEILHGPFAMLNAEVPVLLFADDTTPGDATVDLIARLERRGVDVAVIGGPDLLATVGAGVAVDQTLPTALRPVLQILPMQQLACQLAVARGLDPDAPEGLNKATSTR
jgi:glucosamine--fructose-6-phosphate aminotransferase (isomerizing)